MHLFNHFDFLAPIYDLVLQIPDPQPLISLARLPVNGAVLDAGGGTGRISQVLRGLTGTVIVADLSFGMLTQAMLKRDLLPVNAKTEELPFSTGSFERIIMVDALHHVINQAQTIDELWRLLEPGGRLVIEEPDIGAPIVKLIAAAEKIAFMRSHFLAPQKIAALFHHANARTSLHRLGYNAWVVVDKVMDFK
jgi:ubiquinone/menaquinone biosynthesis C-methylase UbiE